jgi:membrane-associated phospholipid phosphatase
VRPEVTGEGFSSWLLRFLYRVDQPTNLFPSIHCLVSWLCYDGIRGKKEIPAWYRGFSCIFALLVVLSTQFTKQHYIADAAAGLILAEALFQLNKRISAYRYVQTFFGWINQKIYIGLKGDICEQKN